MATPTLLNSGRSHIPAFDADSTLTVSIDVTGGSDYCLVVKLGAAGTSSSVSTLTYNGSALTLAHNSGESGASALGLTYYIAPPATGTNNLVLVVNSAFADVSIIWELWGNVDQADPIGNTAGGNNAFQGSPRSTSITVASGNVATDIIVGNDPARNFTVSGSQTQTQQSTSTPDLCRVAASYLVDATAMAWTFDGSGSQQVAHSVVELNGSTGGDTTPPTLSSASGTGGAGTCSGSVSTDEGNGTLYAVVTASATAPSAAQVKAGQDHTGSAALRVVSQAVSGTGTQNIASGSVSTGTRYFHFMHEDAATNQSTVASSSSFSVTDPVPGWAVQHRVNLQAAGRASNY